MTLLVKSLVTCAFAIALAVGVSFGLVAVLNAAPDQPNVPLVSFQDGTSAP